jgi:hypothetical protein
VKFSATNVLLSGEGDGSSIRIGMAEISKVFTRPLHIPGSAIGYGANHHEGHESFVFDLFADPSLTPQELKQLEKTSGRYLYAAPSAMSGGGDEEDEAFGSVTSGANSGSLILIHTNGKVKPLGPWAAKVDPNCAGN